MTMQSGEIMRIAATLADDTQISNKEIVSAICQADRSISAHARARDALPFELYKIRKILTATARLRMTNA